jgi:signal transduction histidine kinase
MIFHSLQFRLSALVFAFGLLLIGMSILRQYDRDVKSHVQQVRLDAYQEGTRLAGLSQHFFRRRLPQSADLAISYASVQPDLRLGVVVDGKDIIRNATRKQWRGVSLWSCPLGVSPVVIKQSKETPEGVLDEDLENGRLTAIFPFRYVMGEMSQGLVILEYDLSAVFAAAVNHAMHESLVQACLLAGGCLLLWSLLRLLVTERVKLIVEQTKHIGPDEMILAPIDGGDELETISRSIADAAIKLQDSEWRFSQIASNMQDVFWVAPPDPATPVYVNKAYAELFARPVSALLTHHWDWLRTVAPRDRSVALRMLRRLRSAPGEAEIEIRVNVRGRTEWLRCRGFSTLRHGAESGKLQVVGIASIITEQKEMEKYLIEAAENERRRIGQDLHDDVCQRLAAAQLKSGVLGGILKREGHAQSTLAADVARELAEASELTRGYARGLAPVAVRPQELPDALDDLRKFLERAFSIRCHIACEEVSHVLKTEEAALIYRIAQELATNAAKHGRSTWVDIRLAIALDCLRLEVSNDGVSFNPVEGARSKGMGLYMLRQRVDALGAVLTFQTREVAEGGTLAICEMPLASC